MKYLDTRDLQKLQEELQEEKDALETNVEEAEENYADLLNAETCDIEDGAQEAAKQSLEVARTALVEWVEENQEELDELNNLENAVGSEWAYGETLIPAQEFVEYCQELCEDIGGKVPDYIVVDWEATAENLKADYSEVDYQGTTYLFRS